VGRAYPGFFLDIGRPGAAAAARRSLPAWRRKPALLLDRDGVLNEDVGYVCTAERFVWIRGAVEAIHAANDAGLLVLVLTNQSGIARGHYSEEQFRGFTAWIDVQLRDRGAHVDGWYHCPHHPVDGIGPLKTECECRKPRPGLVRRAIADWDLDPGRCLMVGDKDSDLQAAAACGIGGIRFDARSDDLRQTVETRVLPLLVS
jgi:D-glycero-D-manno-heptose 1,7-bisphosphate phosphatase